MAVRQKPLRLKRMESDTSGFVTSLDHLDLQDNSEDLVVDQCDAKLQESRNHTFQAIYSFSPFKSLDCKVFLDDMPILVQVTEVERFTCTRVLNPNLYTIELSYGNFKWKIKRRFKHFQMLHQELLKFKALLKIPLPSRIHSVRRSSAEGHRRSRPGHMPTLPRRPDALVKEEQLISRKMQLEDYLKNILKKTLYRNHPATLEFLEVSQISFIEELGPKGIEGMILKKSGGNTFPVCYWCGSNSVCYRWSRRLSPEIFLKRPVVDGNTWRLDHVLKRKAEQGVKICVLLYKEVEVILGLNSEYTKKTLMGLHSNIMVIRHPDHVPSTSLLWAHHEKSVVIDQSLAFLGGIDLAYGRWDDSQHRLTDVGSVRRSPQASPAVSPDLTREAVGVSEEDKQLKFRSVMEEEELGGEAAGETCLVEELGETNSNLTLPVNRINTTAAEDKGRTEGTGFKHCNRRNSVSSRSLLVPEWYSKSLSLRSTDSYTPGMHHFHLIPHDTSSLRSHSSLRSSTELCGETRFWHGKDYCNFILKDWVKLNKPFDDFIDRYKTPRMPWHDVGVVVHGKAARDIARHFIQRWNYTKLVKKRSGATCYPCLVPKSLYEPSKPPKLWVKYTQANVQVLRSVCQWSIGTKVHEESIHLAYISAIQNSKHYIYIENQFFISCSDKTVHNSIGDALTERILRAYREKKKFRVYVVMPLLPGFEGDISSGGGQAIKAIMHFNYRTMCRGEHSIIDRLKRVMADCWINYISFCGLRTHADLDGRLVTELIYVHSKLMIVDDRTVIIGSANINDRSMLGKRDSEMAVVVEDMEIQDSLMDGQSYQAGRFALSLRMECFRIVLGLLGDDSMDIGDPISDRFYKEIWMVTAAKNASVYDKVFRCLPTDKVLNYKILKEYMSRSCMATEDSIQACAELRKVRGFLVQFPFYFLSEENLFPSLNSKEGIMPVELWT
ncbi:phospholipase D1 isoform X2 [Tachysurus fulvidraco]|uniref:phospholipase D1 isoform X2 n=1 Tax=Tachysurus fulvidraco TaxID=1234273 RepID=UPI001FF0338C|nr:phospholipase D1 isoform X2 [Tachysurus fulvidraco]